MTAPPRKQKKEIKKRTNRDLIEKKKTLKDSNGKTVKGIDGKSVTKHFYGKTDKDINEQYAKWQHDFWTQTPTSSTSFSIIADKWMKAKEVSVGFGTYRGYKHKVEIEKEFFGDRSISSITQMDVQEFMSTLVGYSESSIKVFQITLKAIFKLAISNKLIYESPYQSILLPKTPVANVRRYYTKEQARLIVDFAKQYKKGLGPFLGLKTGVRPQELIALNLERDFDFDRKILTISKAIKEEEGYTPYEGETKNGVVREIPIDEETIEYVQNQIKAKNLSGYLFLSRSGGPKRYKEYNKWIHQPFIDFARSQIVKDEELERLFKGKNLDFTPYEFRHTFGTRLHQSGTDMESIRLLMGHRSIEVTKKYIHNDGESIRSNIRIDF